MASADETSVKTLGGKGSSLSSATVNSIAHNLSKVKIDSSIIEKLSKSKKTHSFSHTPLENPPSNPIFLTLEQSRASLAVLLNKLVVSDLAIRPNLPFLIEETLNSGFNEGTLDFGSVLGFFYSLCRLNGREVDDVGVTVEEIRAIENSLAALIGICALLDCSSSILVTIADVVAALSCEALKADLAAFDLPVSGEGFSVKDETDVASDMKVLLFGSKLVGRVDSESFSEIPAVHGCFREVSRSVHSCVRVELNSMIKIRKSGVGSSSGKGKGLVSRVLPLATSLKSVGEGSLGRAKMIIGSIDDVAMRAQVVNHFEKSCSGFDDLENAIQSIFIKVKAALETDFVVVLREIYDLFVKLRVIIAWEAALALFVLDVNESREKTQVAINGGDKNVEKKNEKKKNKRALGKGTTVIREVIKDRFQSKCGTSADIVMELVEWARDLCLFFDPKDPEHESLLKKVKEIVESNEVRRLPKIPKGTRDFGKDQMAIRERAFSIIVGVFKRHGAVALDTPVFELRETLMGKYGEDSKLIYDLADQGGEICSLRYDLTVPFARYLAMNSISALKRYQVAKVYRRDNPSKGRYREFYQCDFDVAGQYEPMEPDFEVIKVLTELLNELNIGDFEIKLNHRKLLDGMLEICGVSPEKFRAVCSSIDKLDKQSFEQIKKELVEEKGLNVETAEKIGSFVKKRGPPLKLLSELKQEGSQFLENVGSTLALKDLEILFKALEKSKSIDKVVFDLSLARGLDYYTGVIFEAVFKGAAQVGSIAAGGRYDNLVGMFSGKQVPAVGVSLGIERVFTIMEQLEKDGNQAIRATETQVLVVVLGNDLGLAAELVNELWEVKLKAEFSVNKKVTRQIERAIQSGIPWMVIVGESEQENRIVKLKDIEAKKEEVVPRDGFAKVIEKRLNPNSEAPSNNYNVV